MTINRSKWPAASVAVGGLLVIAGSVLPWAIGDALASGASVTGLEMVEGLATILMGFGIGLAGLLALASTDRPRTRSVVAVLALICLAVVGYFFVTMAQRLEGWDMLSPGGGLYAVAIGSALALAGAFKMKRPRAPTPAPPS